MNADLKISVITIVKNGRQFVEQTIASVLRQSYRNVEYIVIDGGSTDGTVDIIRRYETRITKWLSEPDEGIADAFNKGLSYATGDYILILNSDDALAGSDVLEAAVRAIIQYNLPPILYGDFDIIERHSGKLLYHGAVELTAGGMLRGQVLPHPCLFARRSYFDAYGIFDSRFRVAMDYEWLLRGAFKERIVHVPLLVSKIRAGGLSTLDRRRAVAEIILALEKNGHISSRAAAARMHGYFLVRAIARKLLETFGLYKMFFAARNRLRNG